MADPLYIANAALDLVGQTQIVSLEDTNPSAKKAKLHVYQAIREVLKMGLWRAARKKAVLAQVSPAPTFGFKYGYQLPGDFLRLVRYNDTDPANFIKVPFDIQGTLLLSEDTTASIDYVADLTANGNSIAVCGPELIELMAVKLAQKLAWSFQQSRTLKESLEQEYQLKRRLALAADAQGVKTPLVNRLSDSNWIRDRRFSTNA